MGFKKKRIKDNSKDAIPYDQEVKSVGKILQLLLDDGIVWPEGIFHGFP